jgi:hypothetical protein
VKVLAGQDWASSSVLVENKVRKIGWPPIRPLLPGVIATLLTIFRPGDGTSYAQDHLPTVEYPASANVDLDRDRRRIPESPVVEAEQLPLTLFGTLHSPTRIEPARIDFVNETNQRYKLYWIGFDGQSRSYGDLAPRQRRTFAVNVGRLWFVGWDDGHPVAIFRVSGPRCEAVVR